MPTFDKFFEYDFEDTVIDLDASAADAYTWRPEKSYLITAAIIEYAEATDAAIATPGVVSIDHTPSGGSRTEKGTYTAQVSKAIGEVERMTNLTQFQAKSGDLVILEHKTQQTSTEAGTVRVRIQGYVIPDGEV